MPNSLKDFPSRRRLVLWLLLILTVSVARANGFNAALDRTRIGANETLTLHLTAAGKPTGEPDLTPLQQDFEVLGQSSGTRVNIVNGAMNQTRDWTLELAPRRTGRLQVPSLTLGGQQTQPIAVEVVKADQASPGDAPRSIFLDTRIEATRPYVQQSIPYRVRVLFREQPRRAILSDPEVEGATLERQGEDQNDTEEVHGQHYSVVERRYLVVPQRSGALTIHGPRLEALMPDTRPGARRGPFADFGDLLGGQGLQGFPDLLDQGSGRRVIEHGPDRTIEVRPQPAGTGGTWLPAESVQLTDEWTPSPPRFRVGEPVTRTLVITARGTTAAQLPTLDPGTPFSELAGAKVYPEPPKVEDLPGAVPTALKTLKIALVPSRAGALTLPEIRLNWWDTTTDQARVAVIPQRTVEVAPAAGGATPPAPSPIAVTATPTRTQSIAPEGTASAPGQGPEVAADTRGQTAAAGFLAGLGGGSPWPWLALFFALAWLLTLGWAIRRRPRAKAPRSMVPGQQSGAVRAARARVHEACTGGDPRAARTALLAWARARWSGHAPVGLGDLGSRLDPAGGGTAALLLGIDRAIYAPAGEVWNGNDTWQALEPILREQERGAPGPAAGPLPELYPKVAV